jgi:D-amino-acid dehydrogenase
VNSIHEYFPNMRLGVPDKKDVWYGFRPCSPDGMPYLGFTNRFKNLIIAGGHAMMGLSLGPASGKVVADLASGVQPEVNIKCFRVDRFS